MDDNHERGAIDAERLLAEAGWLERMAAALLRDPGAAQDLVQETWVVALTKPPREATNVRGWLGRVARNLLSDARRAEGRRKDHEARAVRERVVETPQELERRLQLQRRIVEALVALQEPYRSAVVMRHLDGLAVREIAARQEITESNARQRISRGLTMLRERLDAEWDGGRAQWSVALLACVDSCPPRAARRLTTTAVGKLLLAGAAVACIAVPVSLWRAGRPARAIATPLELAADVPANTQREGSEPPASAPVDERRAADAIAAPASAAAPERFFVTITDDRGRPVPGAEVTLYSVQNADGWMTLSSDVPGLEQLSERARARTQPDGSAAFERAAGVRLFVGSEAEGRATTLAGPVVGPASFASTESACSVRMAKEGTLMVHVEADDGASAGVSFMLKPRFRPVRIGDQPAVESMQEFTLPGRWSAATDASGNVAFRGLPIETPIQVRAERAGQRLGVGLDEITLHAGEVKQWSVRIDEGELHGVAVDRAGSPQPGVALEVIAAAGDEDARAGALCYRLRQDPRVHPDLVTTDASGAFAVRASIGRRFWIVPATPDAGSATATWAPLAWFVDLADSAGKTFAVTLFPAESIRGTVTDDAGAAVAGLTVMALAQDASGQVSAVTDANGAFTLGPLARGSFVLRTIQAREYADSAPVQLDAEAWGSAVALRVSRTKPFRVCMVESGTLAPCAGNLVVWGPAGEKFRFLTGGSLPRSEYDVPGTEAGDYDLAAIGDDGHLGVLRGVHLPPPEGAPPLQIIVEPSGTLELTAGESEDATTIAVSAGGTRFAIERLEPGGSANVLAPPGSVRIERLSKGGLVEELGGAEIAVGRITRYVVPARK